MKRGLFPGLMIPLAVAGGMSGASGADAPRRPNIIVVMVDDLRWDEIGAAGHPFVRTPHIDRIAQEGARFRNAFCTTPLCSPGLKPRHRYGPKIR